MRIKDLLLPTVLKASEISAPAYGADSQAFLETAKEMWTTILSQFNILSSLRTFPIGIPSLLISKGIVKNPLGSVQVIELQSADSALALMLVCSCLVWCSQPLIRADCGVTNPQRTVEVFRTAAQSCSACCFRLFLPRRARALDPGVCLFQPSLYFCRLWILAAFDASLIMSVFAADRFFAALYFRPSFQRNHGDREFLPAGALIDERNRLFS